MRGDATSMSVLRPRTVGEALEALAKRPGAVPLAGGTDFMVSWNAGERNGRTILDLSALRSWRRIRETGTGLRVGALATHWTLRHDLRIRRRYPLLAAACGTVGGRQIQTRGTIGGNIANASPAGDTFPPLSVYDATVRLRSSSGARNVPFAAIFAGVKRTRLEPGELIESIELRAPRPGALWSFRKVGTRKASAISKLVAAGVLWKRRDGRIRELRYAVGSVATTVRRLTSVEELVSGERPTRSVVDEAVALVERDIDPIDDVRSTRRYRLEVTRNLLGAFLRGGA